MPVSKTKNTLKQAERAALEGSNESQDTQHVFNDQIRRHGIGFVSGLSFIHDPSASRLWLAVYTIHREISSLRTTVTGWPLTTVFHTDEQLAGTGSRNSISEIQANQDIGEGHTGQKRVLDNRLFSVPDPPVGAQASKPARPAPQNATSDGRRVTSLTQPNENFSQHSTLRSGEHSAASGSKRGRRPSRSRPAAGTEPCHAQPSSAPRVQGSPRLRVEADIMSLSQSPTQSNDGRSYDHYFAASTSNGDALEALEFGDEEGQHLTQDTSHELRTLQDGDTGAVNFESPVQDDEDFLESRVRSQDGSQSRFIQGFGRYPETPAPENKNPFGQRGKTSQVLPPSQLFARTQSVRRHHFSPTSSRPSPNIFQANDISPNPGVSSPLKARGLISSPLPDSTSSPAPLPAITPPHVREPEMTPLRTSSPNMVQESSRHDALRGLQRQQFTSEYEPMSLSQERRSNAIVRLSSAGLDDDDEETLHDRKQRANLKRAAAQSKLEDIHVPASSRSSRVEVPSTNKKARAKTQAQEYLDQCRRITEEEDSDAGETVADSQEQVIQYPKQQSQTEVSTQSAEEQESLPNTAPDFVDTERREMSPDLAGDAQNESSYQEAIPETSPPDRQARESSYADKQPVSAPIIPATSSGNSARRASEGPLSPVQSSLLHIQLPEPQTGASDNVAIAEDVFVALPHITEAGEEKAEALANLPLEKVTETPDYQSSPPALSTRARRLGKVAGSLSTNHAPPTPAPASSMSTLSSLGTTTPVLTSSTTPGSQESESGETLSVEVAHSSPAVSKGKRRVAQEALPRLKTRASGNLRHSTRLVRHPSASTDELARSPNSNSGFEQSLQASRPAAPRQVRTASRPQSLARDQGPSKLFDSMAFAISFQGKKPGENAEQYKERMNFSKLVEKKIREAGGRILVNGFDELFEVNPVKSAASSPVSPSQGEPDIKLLPVGRSTGFAALVADGHSRKVKYMQALALGLPCIATRWITSCLDKGELLDWSPYLLCAGQSTFLGDAIRSRNLTPYNPSEARLGDVIAERSRLLDGNRVLLIMKRADEGKKMAYVFLARILGASLSRVYSVEEARTTMKAAEDLGEPFDWVYVDDKIEKGDLFASTAPVPKEAAKKRKRRVSAAVDLGPAPKKIRTLSDELVIQSLILGRLIEEGEMEE